MFQNLLLMIFFQIVLGLPYAWHKFAGGVELEWVGYWVDVGRFELGISAARAAWASRWLSDKAAEGRVRLGELREGLGRLQFIAGPLEFLRPFLGPLYAWCAAGPRFAQPKLPALIVLIQVPGGGAQGGQDDAVREARVSPRRSLQGGRVGRRRSSDDRRVEDPGVRQGG